MIRPEPVLAPPIGDACLLESLRDGTQRRSAIASVRLAIIQVVLPLAAQAGAHPSHALSKAAG
jgi:hypothetical protein